MKKNVPIGMLIGLMLLAAVTAFNAAYVVIWNSFNDRLSNLNAREAAFMKMSEVAAYVDEYYAVDYDPDVVLSGAADGYIDALPDDDSYYIPAEEVRLREEADEKGYTGIGIIACLNHDASGICVLDMYEGSTANEFGVERFDLITEVNGAPVVDLGFEGAMERIRGEEGTNVDLVIYRERTEETLRVTVRRGAVVDHRGFSYSLLRDSVGYMRIDNFDRGMDSIFLETLATLKGLDMQALILDLRLNPGGYMDVMTNMADPLIDEGVIYAERSANGAVNYVHSDENALNVPIAVLVGPYTAGPGEYFAAALQAHGARLFGETTAGSGYTQSRIELSDGSVIVLTSAEYVTAQGLLLQGSGLDPDEEIVLDAQERYALYTEETEDAVLQSAIDYLT